MTNEINLLLRQRNEIRESLDRKIRAFRYLAIGLLFVVPSLVVLLFLFIFFSPLPTLQQQERNLLITAGLLQTQAAKVGYINDRALLVAGFIAKQTKYEQSIQALQQQLPPDVTITGIRLGSSQPAGVDASSQSLLSLQTFQQNLQTQAKNIFPITKLQSIGTQPDTHVFTMTLSFTTHE